MPDLSHATDTATAALIRETDWVGTPLGPMEGWPAELRTLVAVMLGSNQPMFVVWGPERTLIYNDAYGELLAGKHPAAMGRDFLEVWHEIRADLVPLVERAYRGEPSQADDITLHMERRGYREEAHFSYSYTPLRDRGGAIAGFFCACMEITAQVMAERARRESETRLRGVLDGMGEGFGILDRDFRIVELNAEARRMEARPHGEIIGRSHWEVYPGTSESELGRLYRHAMAARVPVAHEHCYTWPDGTERCLEMRAYPVEEGLAVFWRDVTDRRRIEAEARAAAERVDLALNSGAVVGTWVWDVQENRLTADERLARSFGLDPAQSRQGLPLEAVTASIHPEDLPRVQASIAAALGRGGAYRCEYRVRGRDGAYHWIEANGRVELDGAGRARRFPGVLLDVEDRRRIESERDQTAALLRAFADAVPGVVFAKDRQGRMLVANRGTAALIGKPPAEFLGRTDAEFLEDKAQGEAIMATDRRIMESGVAEQIEEPVNLPDGTPAIWLSTKAPMRNEAGEVIGLIGSSVDITARKQAEEVLARGKAELERLVEERTRDLEETQARLAHAQRMEALGQLAGGIAHDFNNVLQAVSGGAALIARRAGDPDGVRRLARMVTEAAERGAAITRRLLAFSRRGDLRAEAVDPPQLLADLREVLGHTLGAGIAVRLEVPEPVPPLLADKGQLETVLVNLATNARDAMAGQGVLTLEASAETVPSDGPPHPAGLTPGDYVRLAVADTEPDVSSTSASKGWNLAGFKAGLVVPGRDAAATIATLKGRAGGHAGHVALIAHGAAFAQGAGVEDDGRGLPFHGRYMGAAWSFFWAWNGLCRSAKA